MLTAEAPFGRARSPCAGGAGAGAGGATFFFFLAPREHLEKGLRLSSAPPAEALRAAPSFVAARGAVPKGVVNVGKSRVLPWPIDAFDLEVCPEKIGVYGMNLKINIRVQN